jgi:hypothetical protein
MSARNSREAPASSDRALRLLQGMHAICSHDLPNQAVALESLLHLFVMDEIEQLSPQAREYVQRLQSVARKIGGMAHFLRELVRLHRHQPEVGEIVFARFLTELKGELHRQLPNHTFTWQTQFEAATAVADRRLVLPAAAALVQAAADALGSASLQLSLSTRAADDGADDGVIWRIAVAPAPHAAVAGAPVGSAAAAGVATTRLSPTTNFERRLEFVLGCEFLAHADIACRVEQGAGAVVFLLTIPDRSAHG